MNKPLMILLSLVLCVMSGACVTPKLYSGELRKPYFYEDVSSFLITNDQQKLVIIGKKNHYIFPLSNDLKEILMWNGRSNIRATDLNFVISKGNKINGQYRLQPREMGKLSSVDKVFLANHGFDDDGRTSQKDLLYSGSLTDGIVYDAGKFKMPDSQSFNEPYHLMITYDYASARDYADRALITPVAVTMDGLIVVGAVLASPIILLFMAVEELPMNF